MRTRPPDLTDEDVRDALNAGWGIDAALAYAAVGFGSHHWTSRSSTGEPRWFVTVDDLAARRYAVDESADQTFDRLTRALRAARALHDHGAGFVVAPIPDHDSEVLRRLDDGYAVSLYPHVDAATGRWGATLSPSHRDALLEVLRGVHAAPDDVRELAGVERFDIQARDELAAAMADIAVAWRSGPYAERGRSAIRAHIDALGAGLDRHDSVADALRPQRERIVLTHGEPHPGNVLATTAGLRLIDWDTALVAPPERDLWIVAEGDEAVVDTYERITGRAVERPLLAFYRQMWLLTDIATFTAVLRRPHGHDEDVAAAVAGLERSLGDLAAM